MVDMQVFYGPLAFDMQQFVVGPKDLPQTGFDRVEAELQTELALQQRQGNPFAVGMYLDIKLAPVGIQLAGYLPGSFVVVAENRSGKVAIVDFGLWHVHPLLVAVVELGRASCREWVGQVV